jgi:hypothetical protein
LIVAQATPDQKAKPAGGGPSSDYHRAFAFANQSKTPSNEHPDMPKIVHLIALMATGLFGSFYRV